MGQSRAQSCEFRVYGEFVNAEWCNEKVKAESPKQGTPIGAGSEVSANELNQGGTLPPNVGDPHGGAEPVALGGAAVQRRRSPLRPYCADHFDPLYPDFNTDYPDQLRADEFLNEFSAYVRARDAHEGPDFEMPSFVLLYLPDDHTGGTRPDHARPRGQCRRQ